ncbi:telomerase protein component 1 isoform X2 [Genypterus blacodes]|uniref:telomerase protein component 1 isoform X2 n=1 Tax=Genypterus blacodes TaxID=154954 RepID=UPI003F768910
MKALTLLQSDVAPGGQHQLTYGRSLSSNYAPPNLENKFLVQASLLTSSKLSLLASHPLSCPSLQPSPLSSTSSTLLSTSSLSLNSSLLSTQNTLLNCRSSLVSVPPLSSAAPASVPHGSLLSTSLVSGSLFSHDANLTPLTPNLALVGGEKRDDGGDEGGEEIPKVMQSPSEETSELSEEDSMEDSEPDMEVDRWDHDQTGATRQEEFADLEMGKEQIEEELKDKKYLLLNAVCSSLVNKNVAPGQKDWDLESSVWTSIKNLAEEISAHDPEFLLKVAVYTRQELNIRITANFLLALAANQPSTKPHFRRYFCACIQLPSDWLEVVQIYTTCFSRSLPACLKKAMADKFKQFNEYQLAKYNTRKHRCKHNKNKPKRKKPTDEEMTKWANLLRSDPKALEKFITGDRVAVVDKKQSEFSIKKMIHKLHIKEPAEHVMAILGRKYPADMKAFIHSGLSGIWDREKAGKRMKLKEPETWERLLSREGNKAATWEKLIDKKSLPFMAMLRNLRNMITRGISEAHHQQILNRLTDKKSIIQSRQFPFRFLAAYKVIMELNGLASASQQALPSATEILKGIMKKIPKGSRFKRMNWETEKRQRLRVTLGVPFIYRLYRTKKAALLRANQRNYTVDLLDRYRKALETSVQLSCRYNVPPLPGRTVILLNTNMRSERMSQKPNFCLPPDPEKQMGNKDDEDEWEDVEDEEDEEVEDEEVEDEDVEDEEVEDEEVEDEDVEDEDEDEDKGSGSGSKSECGSGSISGSGSIKDEDDSLTPSMMEVAILLSLMISSSAEDASLLLLDFYGIVNAKLQSDVLLDNVRSVQKQIKAFENLSNNDKSSVALSRLLTKKNKVDNIIIVCEVQLGHDITWILNDYSRTVNDKALTTQIFLSDPYSTLTLNRNTVSLVGFSEQTLRFVAERGSSRLLEHVEHLDKLHKIPPPEGAKDPQVSSNVCPITPSPKLRWRGVRVFISSTFRDMHAERDILVRSVFPELRRRAAPHCLYLQEVELRWGVTEDESSRTTELCLSEVCRSQMLVGILGQRYGLVPLRPVLPDLPQYSWLASAPGGLSITEMEIRQFQALYPDTTQQRMFCYFRDPNVTKSVPVAWRSDFAPESKEAQSKMDDLKKRILDSDVKVTENYPCEWGDVTDGKPYLKGLDKFGKAVLEDIWTALLKQFVEEDDEAEVASDVKEQEVQQEALQRQFYARAKLLSGAVEKVQQLQTKGGMMLVEGAPGEGKTVFMAALANALRSGDKSKRNLGCDAVSYSTASSQSARSVENLLRCLIQWLRKMKDMEEEAPLPQTYQDLLSEFHSRLSEIKKDRLLVLLVDGVDLVQDGRKQNTSDWIPQQLPQGLCLVLSVTAGSPLLPTLVRKRGAALFTLGQLSVPDRREIIQKELDAFGKKLSDAAFNNQLQTLIMKKGAVSPLYLHLACEDLRNFASFDKLKENLQSLPQSLSQLVQYSLDRLCSQYRGVLGLRWALAALTVSSTGLRESDLYAILNTSHDIASQGQEVTMARGLSLCRKPKGRVPMATFTRIVRSLQSLIGPSNCQDTDNLLALTNAEVKRAFEDFFLPTECDRVNGHCLLAAHLWTLADPLGKDTYLHCEANTIKQLPLSLWESGEKSFLSWLLISYAFLHANVRHGLLHHLLEVYGWYGMDQNDKVSRCKASTCMRFLRRHATLLSSWPALFIQQALNEPPDTAAHSWAQGMMGNEGARVVEWQNNENLQETSDLVSTFSSEPTCVAVSPDGGLMVVCTGKGTLHVINMQTTQEVKSLVSSCDGITSCAFLNDGHLATTSYDGRIEMWDIENGCRTALIDGHTNTITGSDITADRKHLATVSLDFMLKVWSPDKGHELGALSSTSPLNCVTFDPEGLLLAAGCWNGDVIVWKWLQNKKLSPLSGHQHSVRSLSFSPSSSMLCSGSLCGEVRVWSVLTSTCVGRFQAHCGSTDALTFLENGNKLLSAGSDHTLQLWSGGLGQSVTAFTNQVQCEQEPPLKKMKVVNSEPAALCVAVKGDYAAVGYHGDGIKLFNLDSGERLWATEDLQVSIMCLMWLSVEAEQDGGPELLVSGGADRHLMLWKRQRGGEEEILGALTLMGEFGVQQGSILALAQNSSYLASASDDFTIALWSVSDLTSDPWTPPTAGSVLRGHTGGVTCLAFSPDGGQLLSGGKDLALMLWDVSSSPPALSKSLPHSHRDWITGCAWTPDCVLSSSNDGRLRVWDLQGGCSLREICWGSPLTSICCLGPYVVSGCGQGALHVWNWETSIAICHISAHKQRIHHCYVLPRTDVTKEVIPEEMIVSTASDDGTVQLWKPFQVEHFSSFQGHNGGISGIVAKEGVPEVLTVSADCSLRCWTWSTESPRSLRGSVTALCFLQTDDLLLAGYEAGLLELWQHSKLVGHKQLSDSSILAMCSMPDGQFAVSCRKPSITLWKVVWNHQHSTASLVKVATHTAKHPVLQLYYCSRLMGVTDKSWLVDVMAKLDWNNMIQSWQYSKRILGLIRNDERSMWLVGSNDKGEVHIGFMFAMGPKISLHSAFCCVDLEGAASDKKDCTITAMTMDREFVVGGDIKGNMWYNHPPDISSWSSRKPAHSDRISVLRLTESNIISASYDRTVKLWDRNTKKQVGMFVCGDPVVAVEVNPEKPNELVCGDGQGKVYFLSWKE